VPKPSASLSADSRDVILLHTFFQSGTNSRIAPWRDQASSPLRAKTTPPCAHCHLSFKPTRSVPTKSFHKGILVCTHHRRFHMRLNNRREPTTGIFDCTDAMPRQELRHDPLPSPTTLTKKSPMPCTQRIGSCFYGIQIIAFIQTGSAKRTHAKVQPARFPPMRQEFREWLPDPPVGCLGHLQETPSRLRQSGQQVRNLVQINILQLHFVESVLQKFSRSGSKV
jgi:hypothetical protein